MHIPSSFGVERLLSLHDVAQYLDVPRAVAHRLVRSAGFPAPRELARGRLRWLESEIVRWLRTAAPARHPGEERS